MEFEWDPRKAAQNLRKHHVSFHEAQMCLAIFSEPLLPTPTNSAEERRYITVGLSTRGSILLVAHAARVERIRIIGARRLTRGEKRIYEEAQR